MNRKIKQFGYSGEFLDDSVVISTRITAENIVRHDMRSKGYVRVLDIDPAFSVEFTGETWKFLMSIHGVYVGKKKAWQLEGITQGKSIPRTTRRTISSRS